MVAAGPKEHSGRFTLPKLAAAEPQGTDPGGFCVKARASTSLEMGYFPGPAPGE